jgi:Trk K+ transport system NAD-binding subunit
LANAAKAEILKAVNIKDSCGVIVAIKNFKQKHLICDVISSFDYHINTIVIVSDKKEQEILEYDLHIDNIVNESEAVSNIMVERAMKCAL